MENSSEDDSLNEKDSDDDESKNHCKFHRQRSKKTSMLIH